MDTGVEFELNERLDDIVARLDSTQRAEAAIKQMLAFLVDEMKRQSQYERERGRAV